MNWKPVGQLFEPIEPGLYLTTVRTSKGWHIEFALWDSGDWSLRPHDSSPFEVGEIVAWAQLPEPYEPPRVVHLEIENVIHEPRKGGS